MTLSVIAAPNRYVIGPYFLGALPLGSISIVRMGQPGGVWLLAAGSSNSNIFRSFEAIQFLSQIHIAAKDARVPAYRRRARGLRPALRTESWPFGFDP